MRRHGIVGLLIWMSWACAPEEESPPAEPHLLVESSRLDFDEVLVGASAEATVAIDNDAGVPAWVDVLEVPEGFWVEPRSFEVPALGREVFRVSFTPLRTGDAGGTIRLRSRSGQRLEVSVGGKGIETAVVISPALDFGRVRIGVDEERVLVIRSAAERSLLVEVGLEGDAEFTAETGSFELPPGEERMLAVGFRAEARGAYAALLRFSICEGCAIRTTRLLAEAVPSSIVATPPSLDFGAVPVGLHHELTFQVQNLGDRPVELSASLEPDDSAFALVEADLPILPEARGTITVRFAPNTPGAHRATLGLRDLEGMVHETVLQGWGGGPWLAASPSSIDFGENFVGKMATQRLRLENVGEPGVLVVTSLSIAFGSSVFTLRGPALPIEVTDFVEVDLGFVAEEAGDYQGELVVGIASPVRPKLRVPLSGSARAPTNCWLVAEPMVLRFGLVGLPTTRTKVLELRNAGQRPCTLGPAEISGPFADHFALVQAPAGMRLSAGERIPLEIRLDTAGAPEGERLGATLNLGHGEDEARTPLRILLEAMASTSPVVQSAPLAPAFEPTPVGRAFVAPVQLSVEAGTAYRFVLADDAGGAFAFLPYETLGRGTTICDASPCREEARIAYRPKVQGPSRGTLEIWVDDHAEPVLLDLEAEGLAPCSGCDWPEPYCGEELSLAYEEVVSVVDPWPHECHWAFGSVAGWQHESEGTILALDRSGPGGCIAQIARIPLVSFSSPWVWNLRVRPDGRAAACGKRLELEPVDLGVSVWAVPPSPLRLFVLRASDGDPADPASWASASVCSGPDEGAPVSCSWSADDGPRFTVPYDSTIATFLLNQADPTETYYLGVFAEDVSGSAAGLALVECGGNLAVDRIELQPGTFHVIAGYGVSTTGGCSRVAGGFSWPYPPTGGP